MCSPILVPAAALNMMPFPSTAGEVKRMYREGVSHYTSSGMDSTGHADGYSEVYEDGRKLQIYGKAAEVILHAMLRFHLQRLVRKCHLG